MSQGLKLTLAENPWVTRATRMAQSSPPHRARTPPGEVKHSSPRPLTFASVDTVPLGINGWHDNSMKKDSLPQMVQRQLHVHTWAKSFLLPHTEINSKS